MTIASEITKLNTNLTNSYTACQNKGATMPTDQNFDNLATCISSISTGGGGSTLITKTITQNGTYNASSDNADGYSQVTVNVPSSGGVGIPREVSAQGVYQMPSTSFTFSLPSNATDVNDYALYYSLAYCTSLTSVDLSSLTAISGERAMQYTFSYCTNLTTADLSSLTTIGGSYSLSNTFNGCTSLTSVDLSSLTNISGTSSTYYLFYNCTGLTSVDLSNLTTISGNKAMNYTFNSCTNLSSVNFNNLKTIGINSSFVNNSQLAGCFNNCNKLTSITFPNLEKIYCTGSSTADGTFGNNKKIQKMYFPKLNTMTYGSGASSTNQVGCKNIFTLCSALTELHFGSANRSAIEASPGYSTAWGRGAGNVTIYFDL